MNRPSDTQSKTARSEVLDNGVDFNPNGAADVPGYDMTLQITKAQAREAKLKTDLCIMPVIILCFCFLQFDRTNIGNALTDTLREDISLTNADINLAQTLFTVGFVITELPFNMISRYMGPERFLPITMFLWGIVTWSQVFLKNATGLYVTRFLIGALEGGYIPGFALYISRFYTNQELALRYAMFWASNSFAGALGGPLSIGLLSLRGRGDLSGWQWLFLVGEYTFPGLIVPHSLTRSRRNLDLLPRCLCLLIPSAQCRHAQDVFRLVLLGLHRPTGFHHRHEGPPQRPVKSHTEQGSRQGAPCRGDFCGLAPVRPHRGSSALHGHDLADEHLRALNDQVTWIYRLAGKRP